LSYGRGRPRPLFLGAAPKVILACFAAAQLHKIFDHRPEEIAGRRFAHRMVGVSQATTARIRKAGFYFSNGELEPNLAAVAAPLQKPDGSVLGALSLVTTVQRMAVIDMPKLTQLLVRAAKDITVRIP
jgi:DNA-binding IclR family transcriptional regulator